MGGDQGNTHRVLRETTAIEFLLIKTNHNKAAESVDFVLK